MNELKGVMLFGFPVHLGAINWLQLDANLLMGGVQGGQVGWAG